MNIEIFDIMNYLCHFSFIQSKMELLCIGDVEKLHLFQRKLKGWGKYVLSTNYNLMDETDLKKMVI